MPDETNADGKIIVDQEKGMVSMTIKQFQEWSAKVDHDDQIREKSAEADRLKVKSDRDKETSAASLKAYNNCVNELRDLAAAASDPQQRLPLSVDDDKDPSTPASKGSFSPETWAGQKITDLDVPSGVTKPLTSAGITTLGDYFLLSAGLNSEYPKGPSSVKGLGAQKVTIAEQAFDAKLDALGVTQEMRAEFEAAHTPEPSEPQSANGNGDTVWIKITKVSKFAEDAGVVVGKTYEARLSDSPKPNAQFRLPNNKLISALNNEYEVVEAIGEPAEESELATADA